MSDVIPAANGALMSFIERAAKDPEFDVSKFGELLRLQRDVGHDQARRAFNAAMADAQAEMMPVVRDAKNNHLGNRYARLETIDAAMRPIYTRHGFSVRYGSAPAPSEGFIRLTCTVAHAAGYFEENYLDAPLGTMGSQGGRTATTPVQSVGSAVTYLRRYLLGMVFNIVLADDDDDGEASRRAVAAASPMPRGARVAERAPAYEAPAEQQPRPRTRRDFLDALAIALRDAQSAEEVDRIVCAEDVMRAKESFRNGHKAELDKLIADALAKWWTEPPADEAWPGEAPDIIGQDKVAAG